ncbi:MAG: hypothetical protein IPO98_02680 [Saprospiraceae bacterium]|nr:hypothetical protein [Saprospiraceae bacterium]
MKRYVHLLLLLFAAVTGLQAQTPVAAYAFTGNAKDGSAFKNDASVNGASLTSDRFGWANSAISFDGKQGGVTAPNAAQLQSDNTTISFWIKVKTLPAQGEVYLLSHGGWQERWKISLPAHGKPVFTTHAASCCNDMDSGDGNELKINEWRHVVMTHDGTTDKMYMNGIKVNEKAYAGALGKTTSPLGMGYDPIDKGNYFDGQLDEVMIYDIALTAAQITALYTSQSTAPVIAANSKVASYRFDEFGKDGSVFGNNASVSGATYTTDRFGYGNSALSFDGKTSKATASNSAQLSSPFTTVSFWVKVGSLPAQGEVYLLSNGGWQERWKISLPSHGKPVFTTHTAACCNDMDSGAGNELKPGEWKHVVVIHDTTGDRMYMNGVKVNEKAYPGALAPTVYPLGIGYDPIDKGSFFDGQLDDIEIFNYAFSDQDVMSLFNTQAAFPGTANALVASYSLNGNGRDTTQFKNNAVLDSKTTATTNRHGWASNAISGSARAENSAALQSDFTTISFWVNPKTLPASGEVFLMSNGGWQERWKISLPSHGKPVFTTNATACCSDMDSGNGNELKPGQWTHLTMVHNGIEDQIYVNGVLANQKATTGALKKTKYSLGIGYDPIDNGSFFDGSTDDVMIFNKALTGAEILAIYNSQKTAVVSSSPLVANYTFDLNNNDQTAYQNHAYGNATGTKDRFGKTNKARNFDGKTAYIEAGNSAQLASDFTSVSFWVKVNSLPASGETFLLSHGGWQERWKISLPSHGKPVFTTNAVSCCNDMDSGNGNELKVGEWKHLVMTHDGVADKMYMNGVKVNEKAYVGALKPTKYNFGIGYDPIDKGNYFDGALDEVQIYNKALSALEVADLYTLQSTAPAQTDTIRPNAPLDITAAISFTSINLSWALATDNVGVTGYNIYQDGLLIRTVSGQSTTISGLKALTAYVLGASAVDAAGNESLISTLKATTGQDQTPDTTPPTKPGNLRGNVGSNSVLLSWDASTDDRKLAGYVVLVDGLFSDSLSDVATSKFIGGLLSETSYTFEVYAFDLSANKSQIAEITIQTTKPLNTGEAGLVAHYPFDGNANDATPYNNHGTIGGNPVFETATHPLGGGKQNIKFDGDRDSVLVNNAVQLISDYTTVSFWIRVDNINTKDAEAYVIDFGHWSERWKISLPQHLKIVWTTNGKNVQFPTFISDMDSGDGNEMVKGFWWHVTMVHDGAKDIIYVNGQQVASKPVATKLNSTNRALCFGSNNVDGGQYFPGALDNVKIYNKALTPAEILKLFNSGTTGLTEFAIAKFGNVKLSPNPVSNILTIEHSFPPNSNIKIRILDNVGRQYDGYSPTNQELGTGRLTVDTDRYSPGLYYVNFIVDGKDIGSVKFSKI